MQGNYSHSLAEYTLAACNWFAKDLPRLRAQQKAKLWQPYDVEELRCPCRLPLSARANTAALTACAAMRLAPTARTCPDGDGWGSPLK
jgi:hypothetical protein